MERSELSRSVAMALPVLMAVAALLALLGWIFHLPRVLSSLGDSGRMAPDTSALFLVVAASLLLISTRRARKLRLIAAGFLSVGGMGLVILNAVGLLDLLERAILATLGFLVPGAVPTMSLMTSLAFLAAGVAIFTLSLDDQAPLSKARLIITVSCGTVLATLGCICILLYVLNFPTGNLWLPGRWMIRMAIETAILSSICGWALISEAVRRAPGERAQIGYHAGAIACTLLLLLFVGVNATLEVALQNNLTVRDKIRDAQQSRVSIHHLIAALHEAESGQRGYLLTMDPAYLRAFDTGRGDARNELARILPVGEQWPEVEALRTVARKKLAELDEAVVLQQSERGKEARSILETGRGRNLMERVEELQKLIDQRLEEQTNERNVAYWRSSDLVRKTVITSYVLAFALLLCAAMMFWEEIRRRVAVERELRAGEAGLEARIAERTRELRESEAKFRDLTNAIPQVVWRSDANGVVDFYNERWYELTGAPRDVRGDNGWVPYVHPEDLAASAATYRKTLREDRPFDNEMRLWDQKRQAFRWYLVRSLPLRDERGKVCNWLGTSTDIHDLKEAAQRLEELHDAVESSRP